MNQIRRSKPTAKKQHQCDWCGLPIKIGTEYENSVNEYEGIIYAWKNHIECSKIANELKMFDSCDEGLTGEDFRENIEEEFRQIMMAKYSEIYESPDFSYPNFESQLEIVKNNHLYFPL